jgi:hypothetical protein
VPDDSLDFDPKAPRSNLKLMAGLHGILQPNTYLEIGVRYGDSLALSGEKTFALGVDPEPRLRAPLPRRTWISRLTSDAFFRRYGGLARVLPWGVELALIDGMHLAEFVIRDFINVEKYMSSSGVVAIDDTCPRHESWTSREPIAGKWTGDVWKALAIIRRYRPDLVIGTFDVQPAGLTIIRRLDPGNRSLADNYQKILGELETLNFDMDFSGKLAKSIRPYSPVGVDEMLCA